MSLPLATTTVSVFRRGDAVDVDAEFRSPDEFAVTSSGTRAHIARPRAVWNSSPGGTEVSVEPTLFTDPLDVRPGDRVADEETGDLYEVRWVSVYRSIIPHVRAGLSATERLS